MKRSISVCAVLVLLIALTGSVSVGAADYSAWFDAEYTQTVESAFTFAFVGDTQKVAYYAPEKMSIIYDWIVEGVEEKNIKFVAGLGDITDKTENYEWEAAISAVQKMDGVVPYSLIRGNHDGVYQFVKYVNYENYTEQLDGMYKNVLNTYQTVTVGTLEYLFLNLDHGPADDVLEWACQVVEAHPKHNVIITTHGYINSDGELLTPDISTIAPSETTGVNDGPAIWDGLVKKYENIVMVVCGHVGSAPELASSEVIGDNGNKIQQVLVDPQRVDLEEGPSGIVALFHFSEDGKTVQVENYSTIKQSHFGPGITFELNSVGGNANEEPTNLPLVIELITLGVTAVLSVAVLVIKRVRRSKKENKTAES